MPPFVVSHDSPLPVDEAWARVTDWPRHGDFVPLTTIELRTVPPTAVGTIFNARTGLGRAGFDDPMEVVVWQPPIDGRAGRCRLEKRGRVMLGWAELVVETRGSGSVATWSEEVAPAHLPAFTNRLSAGAGRVLFGRVLRRLLGD